MSTSRLVEFFLSLIKCPSTSCKEGKVGELLIAKLRNLGFQVSVDKANKKIHGEIGNIIAKKSGSINAKPVLLCAHMDTVEPASKKDPIIENGLIKSGGGGVLGADDKAGIAAIVEGIQCIFEDPLEKHVPIEIVFTVQEEIGLKGARSLNIKELDASIGFVLDSTGPVGNIIVQSPAKKSLEFVFTGKSAHAGAEPEKGISSIVAASLAIADMDLGRISDSMTANIGIINGGSAKNIVPEITKVIGEARSFLEKELSEKVQEMKEKAENAASSIGATVQTTITDDYPAIKFDSSERVVQTASSAIKRVGLEPKFKKGGGGSDAVILTKKGIPTVNLSIGVENPHTENEFIAIEQLEKAAKLVAELMKKLY